MEWNVYIGDFNSARIKSYNVFNNGSFLEDCKINWKKNKGDRQAFSERLRRDLMYYYWSKCEWEVVVSSWPEGRGEAKIDVYDQVMLNWELFVDYVWEHGSELGRRAK